MRGASMIWRALERARTMNLAAGGEPPARSGGSGISRRHVLAGLVGGAAATTLPHWPAEAQRAMRVAVVGGGLAGLTALDTLRAAGIDATLYEARGATGGRTRSVRGVFADNYAFDEGAQLVNTDHADLLGLIRRFGLTLTDRRGFGPAHELQIGRSGAALGEARLAATLRPIAAQMTADSDRLDRDGEAVTREIDALSVSAYLDRRGLRPGDARDALEAGIRTEYGVEPNEASALTLLWNLPTVDGARLTRISLSDERYLVSGGTAQIAARLSEARRDRIRLNRRLAAIDLGPDVVHLAFADGETVAADRVILALPPTLLREVRIEGSLPADWRALIAEARLGRNEKLIVGYDEIGPWRRRIGFGGAVWSGHDFSAIWDAVSLAPAQGPGALCYFLGGAQVDATADIENATLARRFHAAAARVLPGLGTPNGRIRRTRWCDDPLTRGAYSTFAPGQVSRFGHLFALEEEGRTNVPRAGALRFAGEWLSDAFPGYMNGAVQTGRIAAESILAEHRGTAA
jgi:monoamine oxidase